MLPEKQNPTNTQAANPIISVRNLDFYYGKTQVLFQNSLDIAKNKITSIIGPSGCGKSTHIRTYNRIYTLYRDQRAEGEIIYNGKNILSPNTDVTVLRRQIGMIFQKPSPFPMSIFDNIAYSLKVNYKIKRAELEERVINALIAAALWDEVKDQLDKSGMSLSGGQQQRLCIARAIAIEPQILLDRAQTMLNMSLKALIDLDVDKAQQVIGQDDEVDRLNKTMYTIIESLMMQKPDEISYLINLLSTSRNLERIADLVTNIAEDVIYLVSGKIIRHKNRQV